MNSVGLWAVGSLLILSGFAMVLIGSLPSPATSAGGLILIGPVPIVFGSGPPGGLIVLLSLIAAVLMVLALYLSLTAGRRTRERA